jgi:hypothetical protein
MIDQPNKKLCEECERPIFGRADKKFCSDACRNSFNNRVNSDATNFVRNVNNTLRKNRRILHEFLGEEENKIHRDKLLVKGFDFDFFTSTCVTQASQVYNYCYDIGYLILEDGFVKLLRKIDEN